jgi:hypothetical protein
MDLLIVGVINLAVGITIGYFIHRLDKKNRRKKSEILLEEFITQSEKRHEQNNKILKDIDADQKNSRHDG